MLIPAAGRMQDIVKKGLTNVGLTQRFSGGVMYYSSATGAQVQTGSPGRAEPTLCTL